MQYSLGAVLYYWTKDTMIDFYNRVKSSNFDIVYLGENVCPKRSMLKSQDYLDLAKEISSCGKQVVLSTLNLIENQADLNQAKQYINNGDFLIEANDYSVVNLMFENKLPFVAGSALNIYNAHAIKIMLNQGMQRLVLPVEISQIWLDNIKNQCLEFDIWGKFQVELFGFGYLPLAYSARCFSARYENISKDNCNTCCIKYKEGLRVLSQEKQEVFTLNGIQTQSGYCYNLINNLDELPGLVDVFRLSAHNNDIFQTLENFKAQEINKTNITLNKNCNGFWQNIAGMHIAAPEF